MSEAPAAGARTGTASRGRRWHRPTPGFVLVLVVHALCVAFFVWGWQQPDLDRVWFLHHELELGEREVLDEADQVVLLEAMQRHPPLCMDLTGGSPLAIISAHTDGLLETETAYLLRARSDRGATLELAVRGPDDAWPLHLEARGRRLGALSELADLEIGGAGDHEVLLPPCDGPEIIELRYECSRKGHAGALKQVSVRVTTGAAP